MCKVLKSTLYKEVSENLQYVEKEQTEDKLAGKKTTHDNSLLPKGICQPYANGCPSSSESGEEDKSYHTVSGLRPPDLQVDLHNARIAQFDSLALLSKMKSVNSASDGPANTSRTDMTDAVSVVDTERHVVPQDPS